MVVKGPREFILIKVILTKDWIGSNQD
jgi:hypothetical protein